MTLTLDQLINDYLRRFDRELSDLPRARRREVSEEIAERIDQARAEGEAGDEASTLNLLDRLGDPADIAAEARARLGVSVPKADTLEVAALVFLLVEGFFFGVGWLVGLVLLRAGGSGEACTGPVGLRRRRCAPAARRTRHSSAGRSSSSCSSSATSP